VAGSMSDSEITSTVLWLRSFDLDIRCLEITPYQIADARILLVPRTIVPLPEAEQYQVRVERKEATRARKTREHLKAAVHEAHRHGSSSPPSLLGELR